MNILVRKSSINTKKDVPEATFVCISDLHYTKEIGKNFLIQLNDKIRQLKPTYICFLGDLLNDPSCCYDIYWWIQDLATICKVFIVNGNHDGCLEVSGVVANSEDKAVKKYPLPRICDTLNNVPNVYFLEKNQLEYDNGYGFMGISFYDDEKVNTQVNNLNLYKPKFDNDAFNTLLTHNPMILDANYYNQLDISYQDYINLALSGHTHSGMVPNIIDKYLPGTTGLYTKASGLLPKYSRGKIDAKNNKKFDNAHFNGFILPALHTLPDKNEIYKKVNKILYPPTIQLIRTKKT